MAVVHERLIEAAAVVLDNCLHVVTLALDDDARVLSFAMPGNVRERLLDDPIDRAFHNRQQARLGNGQVHVDCDTRAFRPLLRIRFERRR